MKVVNDLYPHPRTARVSLTDNGQHHYLAPASYDPPNHDINIFRCERNAYRRLKAKGFCERGVIPDFYGVIECIDRRERRPTFGYVSG